jgi:hypothetical protein
MRLKLNSDLNLAAKYTLLINGKEIEEEETVGAEHEA